MGQLIELDQSKRKIKTIEVKKEQKMVKRQAGKDRWLEESKETERFRQHWPNPFRDLFGIED